MTNNNFYSGQIKEGRNDEGTFSRIQFTSSDIYDTISEVKGLVQEGKEKLFQSPDDFRLDMRFNIPKDMISKILEQKDLSGMDVSLRNFLGDKHSLLTLGQNNKERVLSPKNISEYQKVVLEKCNHTLNFLEQNGGFERYSLGLLEMMKKNQFTFESKNFGVDEIFNIWNKTFGWSKEEISGLLESAPIGKIFGIRDKNGTLIALMLLSEQETTEWGVLPNYQGKGLIEPLLVYANSNYIGELNQDKLYVHARYNRSISPSIKTGMKFSPIEYTQFLLTNHVTVDGEYQSFAEGTLDTSLYSDKIIKSYLC